MRVRERLFELAKPGNSLLLFRIVVIDIFITIMLKFFQPHHVLRYLAKHDRKEKENRERIKTIVRYTDFLIRRNIPVLKGACLKRSLILYHFLSKEGLPVVVSFGVAKDKGGLIGHSWLTLNGKPYFEAQEHVEQFNTVINYP